MAVTLLLHVGCGAPGCVAVFTLMQQAAGCAAPGGVEATLLLQGVLGGGPANAAVDDMGGDVDATAYRYGHGCSCTEKAPQGRAGAVVTAWRGKAH